MRLPLKKKENIKEAKAAKRKVEYQSAMFPTSLVLKVITLQLKSSYRRNLQKLIAVFQKISFKLTFHAEINMVS